MPLRQLQVEKTKWWRWQDNVYDDDAAAAAAADDDDDAQCQSPRDTAPSAAHIKIFSALGAANNAFEVCSRAYRQRNLIRCQSAKDCN